MEEVGLLTLKLVLNLSFHLIENMLVKEAPFKYLDEEHSQREKTKKITFSELKMSFYLF